MLFSFLVPVYNTSKYLDRCMSSLLCQKGTDYEIVLLDDGSTDDSGSICDRYAKDYPEIVRVIHKDNEGLLLTRRRGFKEAKGDWFICVDSDDYVSSDLLMSVVEAIDKYTPDMVMYNFQYFTNDGKHMQSRLDIANECVYADDQKQEIYKRRLLTDDINSVCMKAVNREIVDIDADYSDCGISGMCEDAVQVLPLLTNAQKIIYLSKPLYNYRKGHDNITSGRSYSSWMASKTCFFITEKYLDIWDVSEELKQKFYTHNLEVLSNFVRWAFSQSESSLPKSLEDIIYTISDSTAFYRCLQMYKKSYAKSKYLKLSVPIIMRKIKKKNIKGLSRYFSLESRLRSKK